MIADIWASENSIYMQTYIKGVESPEIHYKVHTGRMVLILCGIAFENSVDQDQMASEEAIWSRSTLFDIQFVNF